jgi:hypothetical protein
VRREDVVDGLERAGDAAAVAVAVERGRKVGVDVLESSL